MSDPLRMTVASDDGDTLVSLAGELDLDNAADLEDCFESLARGSSGGLVVDCSLLTFCDTTGLAVFARHLPMSVRAPHPNFRRILEIAGFNNLIERVESREAAGALAAVDSVGHRRSAVPPCRLAPSHA